MKRIAWVGLALGACNLAGCYGAVWRTAAAGVAVDYAKDPRVSGTLDGDLGATVNNSPLGVNVNVHGRFAPDLVQATASLSARAFAVRQTPWFLGVGARALSLEWNRSAFGLGLASPFLEGGFYVFLGDRSAVLSGDGQTVGTGLAILVQAQTGYDLRLTSQENAFWGGLSVGIGGVSMIAVRAPDGL